MLDFQVNLKLFIFIEEIIFCSNLIKRQDKKPMHVKSADECCFHNMNNQGSDLLQNNTTLLRWNALSLYRQKAS